jgi:hypothetical protein
MTCSHCPMIRREPGTRMFPVGLALHTPPLHSFTHHTTRRNLLTGLGAVGDQCGSLAAARVLVQWGHHDDYLYKVEPVCAQRFSPRHSHSGLLTARSRCGLFGNIMGELVCDAPPNAPDVPNQPYLRACGGCSVSDG